MARDLFIGETTHLPMTQSVENVWSPFSPIPSILLSLRLSLKSGVWGACGLSCIESFFLWVIFVTVKPAIFLCASHHTLCFLGLVILNIHHSSMRSVVALSVFNGTDNKAQRGVR